MTFEAQLKQKINQIIVDNIESANLKGAFIAKQLGVNRMYLHRKLKLFYNKNAEEYIQTVRVDFAKQKLLNTDESTGEIYSKVGFSDIAYFSKSFKKQIGITPSNYRKLKN
jgi:two-component system sensor histidine kinase ChiS